MPGTASLRSAAHRALHVMRRRWYLLLVALAALVVASLAFLFIGTVPIPSPPQSSRVLAADGQVVANLHGVEDRTIVPLDRISPHLQKAVVATEDRTFWRHSGVSLRGTVRALFTNVREGEVRQGGSTLTQQYVRNAFDSVGRRRTVVRKLREAALAFKVERSYPKERILELYLNTVYFGRGAYGAEAAAQTYFRKPASELTLPEAAYVAGAIRAPERFQPDRAPDAAAAVRNEVLRDMARAGVITQAEADAAAAEAPAFNLAPLEIAPTRAAYFVEYIRRTLRSEFRLSDEEILGGGLRVETTLDLRVQNAAEQAVRGTLDHDDDPEVALVAMDTKGHIRAMVGGRRFDDPERARGFNYAYQGSGGSGGRQAGSAFKPFTLAAFVSEGYSIRSHYRAPGSITIRSAQCRNEDGSPWRVSNFDGDGEGTIDVERATERSVNTVYAQMVDELTPVTVARLTEAVGGWEAIPPVCAVALGTPSVTPLEMARAYATFAARGMRPEPIAILRIRDAAGNVIARRTPRSVRVLDENVADTVNDVLQGVLTNGTARGRGIGRPAAGKTGTTQNHVDAWFVGYTPSLSTAVWMGFPPGPDGKVPTMDRVHGRRVTGGSFPATIWQAFMREAVRGTEEERFVRADIRGKVIGEPPAPSPTPAGPSPTCDFAFGFPVNCREPGRTPAPSPTRRRPPPLLPLPLPSLLPSLPGFPEPIDPDDPIGELFPDRRSRRKTPSPSPLFPELVPLPAPGAI